jgi:hypothetical protein
MNKVAIFVEGQSELIFVRRFLPLVLGWDKISFECLELYASRMKPVPYKHPNKNAETHFWILNVRNDEGVLSTIKGREKGLIQQGYDKIIALRDMYSEKYCKRSPREINKNVTRAFIEKAHKEIAKMSEPARIKMHFAIMELEAWFLGMYNIFERLNSALNINYIKKKLGFDLSTIDPQIEFFKPADIVDKVLQLVNSQYKKSEHDIESICSKIDTNDFSNAFENGRCISFKNFCDEVLN